MATDERADQNQDPITEVNSCSDTDDDVADWYADGVAGDELYEPATFDSIEFEAKKRQRLDLFVLSTFALATLTALFFGSLLITSSGQTKLILGILTIVASVTLNVVRINKSK
jgi:hypothetical protein